MATILGTALIEILADDKTAKGFADVRRKTNSFLKDMAQGIAQGIGQAVAQGVGNVIRGAIDQLGKATDAAKDLNAAIIRTQKIFGDSAPEILAWAQTTATSLGLSERAALSNASALGNMFTQLGVSRQEAVLMSKSMVQAAVDLATLHGSAEDVAPVLESMNASFRGEYDSLQRYLPAITDAAIKQQALAETGKKSADELTSLDKALATQTLILQGATGAAGAFAEAVERGAAAEVVFAARMEDARADIGQVGLIIQQEFFETLNELLTQMGFYGENIVEQLVVGLTKGLTAITPFLARLRGFFVEVLKPGSPPKLLPELVDWGKAAAEEYLKGWTLADGSMLETLGSTIENMLRSFAGTGDIKETDLVSRVFGSQKALVGAINEWRTAGAISVGTLDAIRRSAGPAGESVGNLVNAYFNLQNATKGVTEAQAGLDAVTRRYDATLSPLQKKLDSLGEAQSDLNDQERLAELGKIINDRRSSTTDRQQARLEQEQILLRDQIDAIEEERDVAVDAEQQKVDAAEKERLAKQGVYDQQQLFMNQQVEANRLIQEEITLRERLADEALAKEEKARRELEAQQSKEAAELERISDAHLRYRLQLADTAGDLEIMRAELAKTTEGSAEYYDILTQIAQLEEKLASERDDSGIEKKADEAGDAALRNTKYLDDFRVAFDAATGALFGTDGKEVQLTPFWAGVAKTVKDIKEAVAGAVPIVMDFIGLFTGENKDVPTADILRPVGGGGGGFFSSIIPGLRGLISNLTLLFNQDWAPLWNNFKVFVNESINNSLSGDPTTFAFYTWIKDTAIPAIEALSKGEWRTAWEAFGGEAVDALFAGLSARLVKLIVDLKTTNLLGDTILGLLPDNMFPDKGEEQWKSWFDLFFGPKAPEFGGPPGSGPPGSEAPPIDWQQILLEALLRALSNTLPAMPIQPQSYSVPEIAPQTPAVAGIAGAGGTTTTSSTQLGPITLVFNVPVTQQVAAAAARTVDDELRARGWSPA